MKTLLVLFLLVAQGLPAAATGLDACQAFWKNGDIPEAHKCLREVSPSDDQTFLLEKVQFFKGDYRSAIHTYRSLSASFKDLKLAAIYAAQAAHHLHRYGLSRRTVEEAGVDDPGTLATFRQFERKPFSVKLHGVDVIPFDYSIGDLDLPSFHAKVNGQDVPAIMDTGGSYIAMSPRLADKLGIPYVEIGEGNANNKPTKLYLGIADFQLGHVHARNVPVYVADSLIDPNLPEEAIFGTTFLSNFLTTIDFPNQRLILSHKDPASRRRHLKMIPESQETMPFYMWSDHFMFTKGGMDANSNLNFFVDSGLAAFTNSHEQAAFYTSNAALSDFGYSAGELAGNFVRLHGPLSLGKLTQKGLLAFHSDVYPASSFGGVKIHGLISHAFLKHYVWTIDFDKRTYGFSDPTSLESASTP